MEQVPSRQSIRFVKFCEVRSQQKGARQWLELVSSEYPVDR